LIQSSLGSARKQLLLRLMPFSRRFPTAFLAFLVPALLASGVALAGDDVPRPPAAIPVKKSAPAAVKGKASELPPSALGYEDANSQADASDDKPDLKIPNKFQFGPNTLHFDAEQRDNLPPGIDANEQAVLNHAAPNDSPLPSYFGLRLTTPMH
jgi:hypothetical protein